MAEGHNGDQLLQTENRISRTVTGNGLQLGVPQEEDPLAKSINVTGNNQVGEGNTQIITGPTTHNTYTTNNYQINIENLIQNGNEQLSLATCFQLKSSNFLTSSTQASVQPPFSTEESSCSCQSSFDRIKCPECGHVITIDIKNYPGTRKFLSETREEEKHHTATDQQIEETRGEIVTNGWQQEVNERQIIENMRKVGKNLWKVMEKIPQLFQKIPQVAGKLPQVVGKLPQIGGKLPQIGEKLPQIVEKVPRFVEKLGQMSQIGDMWHKIAEKQRT